jgi:hypothetical protein
VHKKEDVIDAQSHHQKVEGLRKRGDGDSQEAVKAYTHTKRMRGQPIVSKAFAVVVAQIAGVVRTSGRNTGQNDVNDSSDRQQHL